MHDDHDRYDNDDYNGGYYYDDDQDIRSMATPGASQRGMGTSYSPSYGRVVDPDPYGGQNTSPQFGPGYPMYPRKQKGGCVKMGCMTFLFVFVILPILFFLLVTVYGALQYR